MLDGVDTAKMLGLSLLITVACYSALMLMPVNAPLVRGGLCAAVAVALVAYLLAIKPTARWLRRTLIFWAGGLSIIAMGVVVSA